MTVHSALRHRFEAYRPEVEVIAAQVATAGDDLATIAALDGYIDSGGDSDVFRLSDPGLVVKLPYASENRGSTPLQVTRAYVEALIPGIGCRGLAQIRACNDDRRRRPLAVICDYVEGPTLRALDEADRHALGAEDYLGLIATFQFMQAHKLGLDQGAANIKRNSEGLVIVDYELDPRQSLTKKVITFAAADMLLERAPFRGDVPEYGLLYRDVCAQVLGGDMAAAIETHWRGAEFRVPR